MIDPWAIIRAPVTEEENQAFRDEHKRLIAKHGYERLGSTTTRLCGVCGHEWISWKESTCPKAGRHLAFLQAGELQAANAAQDAKEAALDAYGYGGKAPVSPDQIIGLADFVPSTTLAVIERYAGATVDIPGGSIELGLQRDRGEPIDVKRAEARRICEEEALVLNGDDVDEASAAALSDRIDARFAAVWPGLAWFIEIWNARERLTQVYHRWQWPGDAR